MGRKIYFYVLVAFLKLRLHVIFAPMARGLEMWAHYTYFSAWIRKYEPETWDKKSQSRDNRVRRTQMHQRLLNTEQLDAPIDYLEFGVSKGESFNWWLRQNQQPTSRFHGFDTFTGLPEAWLGYDEGAFTNNGNLPDIGGDVRGQFHQGLFQDTLPSFLKTYASDNRKIIHLDADTYSGTLYVLTQLANYLKPNDLLIFDEFSDVMGEFRAFRNFAEAYYLKYEVLGAANSYCQVAIKLL
jgi:O-methyltransferase